MRFVKQIVIWQSLAMTWWLFVYGLQRIMPMSPTTINAYWEYYFVAGLVAFAISYQPITTTMKRNMIIAIGIVCGVVEAAEHFRFATTYFSNRPDFLIKWIILGGVAHLGLFYSARYIGVLQGEFTMKRYKNIKWGFSVNLPQGWKAPGFFRTIVSDQATNPEFFGSNGSSVKFAVGPISPQTTAKDQIENLKIIAEKYGHNVIETETIKVNGVESAVVVTDIPRIGVVKNYSLIFGGTEYFVTASGDFSDSDKIVNSFIV